MIWYALKTLLFCFLLSIVAFAQEGSSITGVVQDTTGHPVAWASVVVRGVAAQKVLGFGTSTEAGIFAIQVATDSLGYRVTVRSLGYAVQEQTIQAPQYLSFVLAEEATELETVLVEAKALNIRFAEDTTVYRVEAFVDGSEQNIEELLKKLPGVEISDGGQIKFKDKVVSAVMLDGDDLLGKNYQLLTRNARADLVEEVEAIENYDENPVLRRIEGGEETVINLKFRKDRKKVLFGNVAAHYGNAAARELSANLFSYLKKAKIYTQAAHNTIGKNKAPPRSMQMNLAEMERYLSKFSPDFQPFITTTEEGQISSLGQERNCFNNQWVGSTHTVIKPSKKVILKPKLIAYIDRQRFTRNQNTAYLLEQPFNIQQDEQLRLRPQYYHGLLDAHITPDENTFIKYQGEWKEQSSPFRRSILLTNTFLPDEQTQEQLSDRFQHSQQHLQITRQTGESSALIIELQHQYFLQDQSYVIEAGSSRYADYFDQTSAFKHILQEGLNEKHFLEGSLRFPYRIGEQRLSIETGFVADLNRLQSRFTLTEGEEVFVPSTDFMGISNIRHSLYYVQASMVREWKSWELQAQGQWLWNRSGLSREGVRNRYFILPKARLQYHLSSTSKMYLSYKASLALPQARGLHQPFVLSSLQQFRGGTDLVELPHTRRIQVGWQQKKNIGDINLNFFYGWEQNRYRDSSTVVPQFQFYTAFVLPKSQSMGGQGRYHRFFEEVGIDASILTGFQQTQQRNRINGEERMLRMQNNFAQLNLGVALTREWVLGVGGKINQNILRSELLASNQKLRNENIFADAFLNVTFKKNKKYIAELRTDGRYIADRWLLFADVRLTYIASKKTTFYLHAFNINNERYFEQVFLSDFTDYRSRQNLLPRQVLLGLNWNL